MFADDTFDIEYAKYSEAIQNGIKSDAQLCYLLENSTVQYPHTTIRIHSLSEYISVISMINNIVSSNDFIEIEPLTVFRGTKNKNYDLKPSLFRLPRYNHETEGSLVKSFATLRPEAFDTCGNHFELLAKMQHYGLPTRLLDFSTNPLVALYFACESTDTQEDTEDGRVLCHNTNMALDDSAVVDAICGIYQFNLLDSCEPLERYLRYSNVSIFQYLLRVYLGKPLVARPKYWNQRIKNQSAVFMVFPNELYDNLSCIATIVHNGRSYEKCAGVRPGQEIKDRVFRILDIEQPYKIYADEKSFILSTKIWREIRKKYSGNVTHLGFELPQPNIDVNNLLDRFEFRYKENKIEESSLNQDFVSIVVDAQSKPRIRKELESIGFDIAFIYPELEYTAFKLKQEYL